MSLSLATERDPERKRVRMVRVSLTPPNGFPEKYESASCGRWISAR
jgi:hypothetical protein